MELTTEASDENNASSPQNPLDALLCCGLCSKVMLNPVLADCGHCVGCRACVETYFEENIKANSSKRKATRLVCKLCGEGFAKPRNNKKLRVDQTFAEVCRSLRPQSFGPGRASTALDTLQIIIGDIKKRLTREPIEDLPRPDHYRQQLHNYLDSQAKGVADVYFCKCCVNGWKEGVPVFPKWSGKSSKWYLSCPRWTPTNKEAGISCKFFQWISAKDVERLGLDGDVSRMSK